MEILIKIYVDTLKLKNYRPFIFYYIIKIIQIAE